MRGATLSFIQDPVASNLMFTGTEFGLWVSIDGGDNWAQWTNGYGSIPTQDMVIQEREADLVIGTFGRSFYILDDIRPLRALASGKSLDENVIAFEAPNAIEASIGESFGYRFGKVGDALYEGENRPYGALMTYYLKEVDEEAEGVANQVKIEVKDGSGNLVRTLYRKPKAGLNRFNWSLERNGVRNPSAPKPTSERQPSGGMQVLPNDYMVTVSYEGNSSSSAVKVVKDPRLPVTNAEMMEKEAMIKEFMLTQQELTNIGDQIRQAKASIKLVNEQAKEKGNEVLIKRGNEMIKKLDEFYFQMVSKPVQGIFRDPEVISNKISGVMSKLQSPQVAKSANQETTLKQFQEVVENFKGRFDNMMNLEYGAYKAYVQGSNLSIFDK